MSDIFTGYEQAIDELLHRVSTDSPFYSNLLVQGQRLTENLDRTHHYGDTEERRAARTEIIDRLNPISLAICEMSFVQFAKTFEKKSVSEKISLKLAMIAFVLIVFISLLVMYLIDRVNNPVVTPPSPTIQQFEEETPRTTQYIVYVIDRQGASIVGEKVTLIIAGEVYTKVTDSNGNSQFDLPSMLEPISADITVEAASYKTNRQILTLSNPQTIQLIPED